MFISRFIWTDYHAGQIFIPHRHLVFSRNARSGTYGQISRICIERSGTYINGPKKVFQYFAEEETRNLPEIIKKIFPGALRHFRIYVYTTASSVSSSVHSAHVLTM